MQLNSFKISLSMEACSKNLHFSELWGIFTAPSHPYYQPEYLLHSYYQLVISRQIFLPTSSVTQKILCGDLASINSFSFFFFPNPILSLPTRKSQWGWKPGSAWLLLKKKALALHPWEEEHTCRGEKLGSMWIFNVYIQELSTQKRHQTEFTGRFLTLLTLSHSEAKPFHSQSC